MESRLATLLRPHIWVRTEVSEPAPRRTTGQTAPQPQALADDGHQPMKNKSDGSPPAGQMLNALQSDERK
jgi:hypothetical protein